MIAVVPYHFGGEAAKFGYLGVDAFLVISGFLMAKSLSRTIEAGRFKWWKYVFQRILRV